MSLHLPPLPPTGGVPAGPDAVALLTRAHARLLGLAARAAAHPHGRDASVFTASLVRHLSAEEQYLYPAVEAAGGAAAAARERDRDTELLTALRDGADVADLLRAHVAAADGELLPLLRGAASAADLVRLGNRLELAEEAAPTRPHPGTPAAPPWNKLVDPVVGLVDKARDMVSGRATYPRR